MQTNENIIIIGCKTLTNALICSRNDLAEMVVVRFCIHFFNENPLMHESNR